MVGGVDNRHFEHVGNFGDSVLAFEQESDNFQPFGGGEGTQQFGAAIGLEGVFLTHLCHAWIQWGQSLKEL